MVLLDFLLQLLRSTVGHLVHHQPKTLAMIHFEQMGKFMQHDIIGKMFGQQHDIAGKAYGF